MMPAKTTNVVSCFFMYAILSDKYNQEHEFHSQQYKISQRTIREWRNTERTESVKQSSPVNFMNHSDKYRDSSKKVLLLILVYSISFRRSRYRHHRSTIKRTGSAPLTLSTYTPGEIPVRSMVWVVPLIFPSAITLPGRSVMIYFSPAALLLAV